jgi:hypothetical protein
MSDGPGDETEAAAVHQEEVPDSCGSTQDAAPDVAEAAGDQGVQVRDAQESDLASDESLLIEIDPGLIPGNLRLSDVMAVYRAAGFRLRIAVDDAATAAPSEASTEGFS